MGSVFSSSTAAATSSQQQPTTANNSNNNGSTSEFSSVPPRRDSGCRQRQSRNSILIQSVHLKPFAFHPLVNG